MEKENEKISGYLPCFDGFYNSSLEFDDERVVENIEEDRQGKDLESLEDYNDLDIDYKRYRNDISKIACDIIESDLVEMNLVLSATFESLYSPREYNFSTDSVNVYYDVSEENKKNILEYVLENLESFETYIKDNFTDRPGFISFYSNDFHTWINQLKSWEFEEIETQFSVILEFILKNELDSNDYYDSYSYKIMDEFTGNNSFDEYVNNYEDFLK